MHVHSTGALSIYMYVDLNARLRRQASGRVAYMYRHRFAAHGRLVQAQARWRMCMLHACSTLLMLNVCNFGLLSLQVLYGWVPCPHQRYYQQSSSWISRQRFILWTRNQLQPPRRPLNPYLSQLPAWQSRCHNHSLPPSQPGSPSHNKLHRSQPHQLRSWHQPACTWGMESCHSRSGFSRKYLISSSSRCKISSRRRGSP